MIEFKMDRKVFLGLLTVLGVGLALGLGLLLGKMMGGDDGTTVSNPVAPAPAGQLQPSDQQAIQLNPDDPAGAVQMIQGGNAVDPNAAVDPSVAQPANSIDYAALGIAADGELTPEQDSTVKRESQADIEAKIGDPNVIIVDVRSDLEFEEQHVKGAINIPAYLQDDQLAVQLPKDKEIILYCA
jgi:hypothetical protein